LLFPPVNTAASGQGGRIRGKEVPVSGAALSWSAVGNKSKRQRNVSFSFPPANELITAFCVLGNYFLITGAASAIYIISLKQKR